MTGFKEIDLFVFDLDGTALGGYEPYERLPDPFSAFLDDLDAHGVRWGTNTTWHPRLQMQMLARSAARSRPAFLYGRTGLFRACAPSPGEAPVHDAAWERQAADLERWWQCDVVPVLHSYVGSHAEAAAISLHPVPDEPLMVLAQFHGRAWRRHLRRLNTFLRSHGHAYTQPDSGRHAAVILPVRMSKGAALATAQADLGVAPRRTLVAGDGENDLTMLKRRRARFQVCPANAHAAVRRAVQANRGAIGTADFADGVIQAACRVLGQA